MQHRSYDNPTPEGGEGPAGEFPELMRARDLYYELLADNTPLVNLHYSPKQIGLAQPTLDLISAKTGTVTTLDQGISFLACTDPEEPDRGYGVIGELPDGNGYYLDAQRRVILPNDLEEMRRNYSFYLQKANQLRVNFFEDEESTIARIFLLRNNNRVGDAAYLAKIFTSTLPYLQSPNFARTGLEHLLPLGLKERNPLTAVGKAAGLLATYEAAWVDEGTKMELMFRVAAPEKPYVTPIRGFAPGIIPLEYFFSFKRLAVRTDSTGSVIPFGGRVNLSDDEGKRVFSKEKKSLSTGKLIWRGVSA